ncbi:MAG: serine hydrolase [Ardenticatenales bacterium]|nr:serine hydrolase [Ardenticatenales bacterium]
MTDGGAHAMGLESLGLETDDYGFARNKTESVTLDDIARIMIHYSGNAETDYLIERLGLDRISLVMQECGLKNHTSIYYALGFALATFNHENPSFSIDQIQSLVEQVSSGDISQMEKLVELYLYDTEWHSQQIAFMNSLKDNSLNGLEMWNYQIRAAQLLPKGTVREYAHMMAKIASGKLISPEASKIMQEKLESVQSDWILRAFYYDRFGAKDGMTAGVLSLASYEIPKHGELRNLSRVVVIIANQMPPEKWAEQAQYQGHYLLPIDLAQATGEYYKFGRTTD